jgi:hypothetical protein
MIAPGPGLKAGTGTVQRMQALLDVFQRHVVALLTARLLWQRVIHTDLYL